MEYIKSKTPNQEFVSAINVVNFSKKYRGRKDYAVEKASFQVHPGEFHGFIGANGAGKTTTIKSLIGAYAKYEGKITIFGFKNTSKKGKKHLGYIPENANFPKNLSALEYVAHMAQITGISYRKAKKFAAENLEKIGLGQIMRKNPNGFSSGQKKKVLLVQALVNNPDIIIMDEPASNLDPQARSDFFNSLKNLQKENKAIFISSHILSELDNYIDSLTILDHGKVIYSGKVKNILKGEAHAYHVMFNSNQDWIKFSEWLDKEKLKYQKSTLLKKGHLCFLESLINKNKAIKLIQDLKLDLTTFHLDRKTLQQAYDSFITNQVN